MRLEAPAFWWREGAAAARALAPLGALYGMVSGARMGWQAPAAPLPVVCIGSFVLGGAGKTPLARAAARLCARAGLAPAFLSRGYGGAERGPVLVDPERHGAAEVGDEPLILARDAPTVVARERLAGARLLARLGADLAILDDGFHSPSLVKDLCLLAVDAAAGIGNGRVFPAGPLRAPLAAQLRHAGAVLVLGEGAAAGPVIRSAARAGVPVIAARVVAEPPRGLKRSRYLAFAGIARPQKLYASLEALGARVERTEGFPDHHVFSEADCERILALTAADGLTPITTEKDVVRLRGRGGAAARLAAATAVLTIRVEIEEEKRLLNLIEGALWQGRRRGGSTAVPD